VAVLYFYKPNTIPVAKQQLPKHRITKRFSVVLLVSKFRYYHRIG